MAASTKSGNGELMLKLGQIDGRLDSLIRSVEQHLQDDSAKFGRIFERLDAAPKPEQVVEVKADVASISKRVGVLERLRWMLVGAGAIAGGGAAKVLGLLG